MNQSTSSQPKWILPYAVRCLCSVAIVSFYMLGCKPYWIEDGYIYSRYVRNALNGLGLVFNVGEHINSLTSPLYSYLLVPLSWAVHGRILLAEGIVFVVFLCGTCFLAEVLFPWSGLLLSSCVYFYSMVGMETTMFVFFMLLAVLLLDRELYEWLPLVLLLLALTRMEGAAFIPVTAWVCYKRNRWPSMRAYVLPLLGVLVYLGMNHYMYGGFLPSSSTAKFGQGRSGFWGKWPRAFLYGYRLDPTLRPAFYAIFVELLVLPFALRRLRGTTWNRAALPFFGILLAFYVLFNIPAHPWYYAPLIVGLTLYAVAELANTRAGMVVLLVVVAAQAVDGYRLLEAKAAAPPPYDAVAAWLNANTPPDATVECLEIGQFGWGLNRYLYDSLGLTLPKNAEHIAHRDFSSWLEEDKPDYVVYHTTRPFPFERVILQDPNYQPLDYNSLGIMIYKRTHDFGRRGAPLLPPGVAASWTR